MKKLLAGTALCLAGSFVHARTQQDLLRDGNRGSTGSVLTYQRGGSVWTFAPVQD